jgi:hypothetical protein
MKSIEERRMPVTKRLTIENVNLDDEREMDALVDQMFTVGLARVNAEGDELRKKGLLDSQGNLLSKELPVDMQEGADRDFGG